jgi:ribosomal protein S18 acetylase RimI-like enzyme
MNEYSIERIKHSQSQVFDDLFNQYQILRDDWSEEKTGTGYGDEGLYDNEPVIFISHTNYAEPTAVGFIRLYSVCASNQVTNSTIVEDLYVLPDHRKNGIALKLIEAAVKFAIEKRSAFIRLETLQDNLIARKLLESVGFISQTSASKLNVYSIQFLSD